MIVLAHLMLVAGLIYDGQQPQPKPATAAISVYAIPVPHISLKAPIIADAPITIEVAAPLVEIAAPVAASPSAAASGGACSLIDTVQADLRDSAAVRMALGQVPAEARSVANAIMLWDGQWADPAAIGGSETANPIRQRIVETIMAASAECREADVIGPRLLLVPDAGGTAVLVLGSGSWRWAALVK